jgi:hypothetical protein
MSKYPGNIITTGADTGYSVFFDGTGDYLSTPSSANFSFGTGDFTIEYWVYATSGANNGMFQVSTNAGGLNATASNSVACNIFTTNSITVYANNFTYSTSSNKLPFNTWMHLAIVRASGVTKLYINGVLETSIGTGGSITDTTNYTGTYFAVGGYYSTSYLWNGYISNFRVLKGTALYTANFTPPTQLFNITNTSLLTCNSPAIVDQSTNAFAITANGNAAVSTFTPFTGYQAYNPALGAATPGIWTVSDALQAAANRSWNMYDPYFNYTTLKLSGTPVTNVPTWITDASTNNFAITVNGDARAAGLSPFSLTTYPNSGAGYFGGTTGFLTTATNVAFTFGTGDFTVEFWVYPISATGPGGYTYLYAQGPNTTASLGIYFEGNLFKVWNGSAIIVGTTTRTANNWYHVAVSRSGTSMRLFVNGVQDGSTATNSSNITTGSSFGANIGRWAEISDANYLIGYMSNVRVIKGTALYTTTFTPSTAPLTAVTNTSLLTLQNSQSANNNSFLDSSSNNFLITRNGNTTQGTFTPFSQTGWGNFFNGTTDYIQIPDTTALEFGNGNFTVEGWVYLAALPAASGISTIISKWNNASQKDWFFYFYNNAGSYQLYFSYTTNGSTNINPVANLSSLSANTWYHVAACRSGSSLYLFMNGVQVGSTYNIGTDTIFAGTYTPQIAASAGASFLNGYISNLRVLKGTALYTSNFTPSTTPLTNITNTSLLTCQSNRFVDNGTANAGFGFAITVVGTPSVQAFSPFQTNVAYTPATIGGSGYFDGTGDYLTAADNAALDVSSGDFTVECWFYATGVTAEQPIVTRNNGNISTGTSLQYNIFILSGSARVRPYSGTTDYTINVGAVVPNAWNHIALVRTGNTFYGYLNGTRSATTQTIVGSLNTGTWSTYIGGALISGGSNLFFNGYCGGVRVTKGGALYTGSTYTVPTSPFTTTVSAGAANLLLNFTNAGIVDTTGKNVLENVGGARISTAINKFGGSSMLFNGTSDYLVLNSPTASIGTLGDFTAEAWVYTTSSAAQTILYLGANANSFAACRVGLNINKAYLLVSTTGGAWAIVSSEVGTVTSNTWNHIAVVRSGGTFNLFINGTSVYTSTAIASTTALMTGTLNYVGALNNSGILEYFVGYMQDVRVTRGYARYTGNFTPPTSLLQNQ